MPWKDVRPMDEKILLIGDYLRGHYPSFRLLCERFGITTKTGYKWIKRYEQQGMDGLYEQSRRPRQSPLTTPYVVRQTIIALRQRFRTPPGAKKIQTLLAKQFPHDLIPSQTTIYHILRREGLVKPTKKRQKVPLYVDPFAPVHAANELWSADYKGQLKLANGKWCYPLTVMDHHSRYLLNCQGLKGTDFKAAKHQFTRLFRQYGLPTRIRTDNGVPFAARTAGGLSRLTIWWVRLGIVPERIKPGKPQQNGRHERMHRTLKKATAQPPATSFRAQQQRFDLFRREYNEQRPHESLGQRPPATCYAPSTRPYPERLPELSYPDYFCVYPVSHPGVVYCHNGQLYVSHLLEGERIGMEQTDDGVWDIYFGPLYLGYYDIRDKKGNSTPYWTLKV